MGDIQYRRTMHLLWLLTVLPMVQGIWLLSDLSPTTSVFHPSTCAIVPGLSPRQRELCAKSPDVMKSVVSGLRMAVDECQRSFRNQLWNCTLHGRQASTLKIASKESAYVYAVTSAGVTHAIAKACAKGEIEDCGCGPTPAGQSKKFVWAGCSDNVKYGNFFGRRFIDVNDRQHNDARALMNIHNNRVGRRLLANAMQRECKCHGVSGSCVTKTCWKVVPKFDEFAMKLREKYDLAQQVSVAPHGAQLLLRDYDGPYSESGRVGRYLKEDSDRNRVGKHDLVYLDDSPDYCTQNTRGRECTTNCNKICCGRGWDTVRELVEEPCHCKFIWCCEVKCKTCTRVVDRNYCR